MRQTVKERAGIVDTSRIFEGLHLSDGFINNLADSDKNMKIEQELVTEGQRHIAICKECSDRLVKVTKEPKDQDLFS